MIYIHICINLSLLLFVRGLSPPKPAGLDPQIFAGIPQIGCGTTIAKKNWLSCMTLLKYYWPVHLNDKNVSSREDMFLSWHLAPASEVAGGHTLPF
jgi:hypothetical protein